MAIKPIVSFVFATSTNYSVGPQIGNPTKIPPSDTANGVVPGDGIPAAWHNYMWNICGQWSGWLLAGTSAPDLSAHLIETDSNGWAEIGQLTLGGTATSLQSLIVSENTGATSATKPAASPCGRSTTTPTAHPPYSNHECLLPPWQPHPLHGRARHTADPAGQRAMSLVSPERIVLRTP